jgi:short-subunit dehydrogenase
MQKPANQTKVAILGASRGLGLCLARQLQLDPEVQSILAISRKPLAEPDLSKSRPFVFDLASEDLQPLFAELELFQPNVIIYSAGGGPFAKFENSKWQSHQWAFQVTFLSVAKILHWYLARPQANIGQQFVALGSSIAESQGDSQASSYASAKHALLGLYQSIQMEQPRIDFRLFSPGYMNTDLLPKGSWPRLQKHELWEPEKVARLLWSWAKDSAQLGGHMSLSQFADTPRNAH